MSALLQRSSSHSSTAVEGIETETRIERDGSQGETGTGMTSLGVIGLLGNAAEVEAAAGAAAAGAMRGTRLIGTQALVSSIKEPHLGEAAMQAIAGIETGTAGTRIEEGIGTGASIAGTATVGVTAGAAAGVRAGSGGVEVGQGLGTETGEVAARIVANGTETGDEWGQFCWCKVMQQPNLLCLAA